MTTNTMDVPRRVWSVAETAEMLNTSEFTIRKLIKTGQLKALTIGRAFKIKTEEIEKFLGNKGK